MTSSGNSALLHEIRYLISCETIPVVVGVDTFPSLDNAYVKRTGRITLPIGKEGLVPTGGHAMLVVGYDDTEGAFLVRNSWEPSLTDGKPPGTLLFHTYTLSVISEKPTPCGVWTV
jgi:hypothetical protein